MGLKINRDMDVFKGKKVVNYNFNEGNEYTLTLADKTGKMERVRISSDLRDAFLTFASWK